MLFRSEPLVGEMLVRSDTRQAAIESNNGGRGFARAVQALAPGVRVEWCHQDVYKRQGRADGRADACYLVLGLHGLHPEVLAFGQFFEDHRGRGDRVAL